VKVAVSRGVGAFNRRRSVIGRTGGVVVRCIGVLGRRWCEVFNPGCVDRSSGGEVISEVGAILRGRCEDSIQGCVVG